jgi:FMN phosphatase YigB (HAD superfamily)
MLSDLAGMPIRAIVFDLFDTLVDHHMEALPRVEIAGRALPSTVGALHETFAAQHPIALEPFAKAMREIDREWWATHWERDREFPTTERFERLLARLGAPPDAALVARLTDVHMGLLQSVSHAPPHHAAVLGRLRERWRIGLCSNFSHAPAARAVLARDGIARHFDAIVISHEHGLRKPRPEIFEATLAALGVAPDEAVHVGDNLDADVAGANAVGMQTVWITRCVREPDALLAKHPGPTPTWRVSDLAEIEGLLGEHDADALEDRRE